MDSRLLEAMPARMLPMMIGEKELVYGQIVLLSRYRIVNLFPIMPTKEGRQYI